MSDGMTREEIRALVDVQSKHTEQMVLVAQRLQTIAELQSKIAEKLSNGVAKDITDAVDKMLNVKFQVVACCGGKVDEIKDSVTWLKIILGSATLIIIIATVIVNVISKDWAVKKVDQEQTRMIQILDEEVHKRIAEK